MEMGALRQALGVPRDSSHRAFGETGNCNPVQPMDPQGVGWNLGTVPKGHLRISHPVIQAFWKFPASISKSPCGAAWHRASRPWT